MSRAMWPSARREEWTLHENRVWVFRVETQGALTMDKRIFISERNRVGECAQCGRGHIHRDDCPTLKKRLEARTSDDGPEAKS